MSSQFAAAHRQILKAKQSLLQAGGSIINNIVVKMREAEESRSPEEELEDELPFVQKDLKQLAEGGFGTVLLGRHKVQQVPIVVKISQTKDEKKKNAELEHIYTTERDFYEQYAGCSDISWLPKYYGSGYMIYQGVECPW